MAGHNKWSKIKFKKAAADSKRSKVWTKVIREITVAARMGGSDVAGNPRLRKALDDARAANMPKDTMERAVKRGEGGDDDSNFEELVYEGYGPGGVALYIECTTDNRNRTSTDVQFGLRKNQGSLGKSGSVGYLFDKKGQFLFEKEPTESIKPTEDMLLEIGMEHGADDVTDDGDGFTVTCGPAEFQNLREAYAESGLVPVSANVEMVPQNTISVQGDDARALLKLVDALEDLDDVQHVWANFDIDPGELEKLMS
jgi:YebC/PmpR family DNA-binding regulatory protein